MVHYNFFAKEEAVMGIFNKGNKKQKYVFTIRDYGKDFWDNYHTKYIVVDDSGLVIDSGNPLITSAPKENVHLLRLPHLDFKQFKHTTVAKLSHKVGDVEISVDVELTAFFTDPGERFEYDLQDLYGKMVLGGYEHLDDLIRGKFLSAAENGAVRQVFDNYAKHERPILFVEELSKVLKQIVFDGRLITGMKKIEAMVELNTVVATMKITYDDNRQ